MGTQEDPSAAGQRPKGVYCYLVTIKCVRYAYTPRSEIEDLYNIVRQRLPPRTDVSDVKAWELDKLNRWHYHFIVFCEKEPFFRLFRRKYFTVHFQRFPFEDYHKVRNYLTKIDQNSFYLDQLDVESYSSFHNMFIEDPTQT